MAIKDWPTQDRPREKLLALGPAALSDTELLAILLRTGAAGSSAVELARAALTHAGSLNALFAGDRSKLSAVKGLGPAKIVQFQAALELARRCLAETIKAESALSAPAHVKEYLRLTLRQEERECFLVLFLDAQNRVLASEALFKGTLTETSVYPREVVRRALAHNAASVILAHNHPSGVTEPSRADESLTRTLKAALGLVDIAVLDHIIVGRDSALSFAERGLI
ncbi:MAG: DNA repair protein RadC [Burkholderiales bacterium]